MSFVNVFFNKLSFKNSLIIKITSGSLKKVFEPFEIISLIASKQNFLKSTLTSFSLFLFSNNKELVNEK